MMLTPDQVIVLRVLDPPNKRDMDSWDVGNRCAPPGVMWEDEWARRRLQQLQALGLVEGKWDYRRSSPGMRTYWTITPAGTAALKESFPC